MAPSRAFQNDVPIDGDFLQVSGESDILDLVNFVSRHVVVGQGSIVREDEIATFEEEPAPPAPAPPAEPPATTGWTLTVPATGFSPGPATAIGTEIYSVPDGVTPGLPALMSVSWSQTVTITGP